MRCSKNVFSPDAVRFSGLYVLYEVEKTNHWEIKNDIAFILLSFRTQALWEC